MSPCHLHRNMEWADSFGLLGSCQGNDNINTVFDGNMVWCAWKAARSGWTISRRGERAGWGGRAHREQQKDELEKPKLIYFLFLFLDQPPSRCLLSLVAFFFLLNSDPPPLHCHWYANTRLWKQSEHAAPCVTCSYTQTHMLRGKRKGVQRGVRLSNVEDWIQLAPTGLG